MEPHVPTMLLMLIVVNASLALTVGSMIRRGERDGMLLWTLGLVLHGLFFVLLGLRGRIDDLWSIVVANTLLSAMLAVMTEGLCRFFHCRPQRALIWALPAAMPVLFLALLEHQAARVMTLSVVLPVQAGIMLALLWRHRQEARGHGQMLLSLSLLVVIVMLVVRGVLVLWRWESNDVPASRYWIDVDIVQVATFISSTFIAIVMAVSFVIMAKERADARSRELATRDDLTGLFNRRALLAALDQQLAQARRSSLPLTVIAVDVDHFKRVNDTHGHLAGDRVLRHVASLMAERLRAQDVLGRMGGEEFLILLPGTALPGGMGVADALRRRVADTPVTLAGGQVLAVTISAGVHSFDPATDAGADALIHRADEAMYRAKATGRDRVVSSASLVPSAA